MVEVDGETSPPPVSFQRLHAHAFDLFTIPTGRFLIIMYETTHLYGVEKGRKVPMQTRDAKCWSGERTVGGRVGRRAGTSSPSLALPGGGDVWRGQSLR